MPIDMGDLLADLAAETAAIRELVAGLDRQGWQSATPAPGWTIGDQISHLAFFDDAVVMSATDADRFAAEFGTAAETGDLSTDEIASRYRTLTGTELLAWFDESRQQVIEIFGGIDAARRLPWFGLPMSAASAVTARIMETWAHGQDVADALGVVRAPNRRLRHVAHIGVGALPFSFIVNGRDIPDEPIRVELGSLDGELWTWGPATAGNRVTGPALDFCLLVTQRRHRNDTEVKAEGQVADLWLDIAQAFAGPPGPGRLPGQHA